MAPPLRVLIADGNRTIRAVAESALKKLGFGPAAHAENGAQALAILARDGRMDLIVVSLDMQSIDGAGLLRALDTHPGLGRMASVLMVPAGSVLSSGSRFQTLEKPFTPDTIRAAARAAMGR